MEVAEMSNAHVIQPDAGARVKQVLNWMKEHVAELDQEIDFSKECILLGVHTSLTGQVVKMVTDPTNFLLCHKCSIDEQLIVLVKLLVKSYLHNKKTVISKAVVTDTSQKKDLHFSIVLTEDNYENRTEVFSFFEHYTMLDISEEYPVVFQIVPAHLAGRIKVRETLLEK